jgi:hypothetical protein
MTFTGSPPGSTGDRVHWFFLALPAEAVAGPIPRPLYLARKPARARGWRPSRDAARPCDSLRPPID